MIELLTIIRMSMIVGNIIRNFIEDIKEIKNNNIFALAFMISLSEAVTEVGLFIVLLYLL